MSTKKDYQLFNKIVDDKTLSLKAKAVMLYLLSKPVDWQGHLFDIVNHCKDGKKSVMSAVRELKVAGYITTMTIINGGQFQGKYYRINTKN